MEIHILTPVRYFLFHREYNSLVRAGKELSNTKVKIGRMERLAYDNRVQDAVPFRLNGKVYYFLAREIPVPGLYAKLLLQSKLTVIQGGKSC